MRTRWITFDCYGTLVDWQSGFATILRPIVGDATSALLAAYHRHEPQVEAERPFRNYKQVLKESLSRAAREIGTKLTEEQAAELAQHWARLPVFGDVEGALAQLRAAHCKLSVLTNCDEDLFAQTHRAFRSSFDLVVTAEQVAAYKPALEHFRFFAETSRAQPQDWVHVGCSAFHDMAPARTSGIRRIWLDREGQGTGQEDLAVSARISTAAELPQTLMRLFAESN